LHPRGAVELDGQRPSGGIRAEVGDQDIEVQLAFGRTRDDADTLEESYDLFDVSVARMSNAVIAWTFDPSDEESSRRGLPILRL
jgi:hypothetical protein